jgi:hypothetical protein
VVLAGQCFYLVALVEVAGLAAAVVVEVSAVAAVDLEAVVPRETGEHEQSILPSRHGCSHALAPIL